MINEEFKIFFCTFAFRMCEPPFSLETDQTRWSATPVSRNNKEGLDQNILTLNLEFLIMIITVIITAITIITSKLSLISGKKMEARITSQNSESAFTWNYIFVSSVFKSLIIMNM